MPSCSPEDTPALWPPQPRRDGTTHRRPISRTMTLSARICWRMPADMAAHAGDPQTARLLMEEAIAIHEDAGRAHPAARISMRLGRYPGLLRPA